MNSKFSEFLYKIFSNASKIREIEQRTECFAKNSINGLSSTAKALFLWYFVRKTNRPVLFVTSTIARAIDFQNKVSIIEEDFSKFFEPQENSPYQLVFSNAQTYKNQIQNLKKFKSGTNKLLIVNAQSLLQLYPSEDFQKQNSLVFEKKGEFNFDLLISKLTQMGYKRESMVSDVGEFSLSS